MSWPQNILLRNLAAGWGTTTLQVHTVDGGVSKVINEISVGGGDFEGHRLSSPVLSNPNVLLEGSDYKIAWSYPMHPQRIISIT